MNFFVHLTPDNFGAECLGRVAALDPHLGAGAQEMGVYGWIGPGPAPADQDFWSDQLPDWTAGVLPHPYSPEVHSSGWDLDRQKLTVDIREAFLTEPFQSRFLALFRDLPRDLLGPTHGAVPALLLSASLADPVSSATVLGYLTGLYELRQKGLFPFPAYAVLGIGNASALESQEQDLTRALVAQGVLDLQEVY